MAEAAILKIENVLQLLSQSTNLHKILRDCCFCEVEVSPASNLVYLFKSNMAADAILEIVDIP